MEGVLYANVSSQVKIDVGDRVVVRGRANLKDCEVVGLLDDLDMVVVKDDATNKVSTVKVNKIVGLAE
jgi:hypothetical protein